MRRYVLDTNLYIMVVRDPEWSRDLEAFSSAYASRLHLHSVVAMELLTGARTRALRRRTKAAFIAPFERRRRVITPDHGAWNRAGEIMAELLARGSVSATGISRSLLSDCLIAATAAREGFVLVTRNLRDSELIAGVAPFDFVAPWPVP